MVGFGSEGVISGKIYNSWKRNTQKDIFAWDKSEWNGKLLKSLKVDF